MDDSRDGPVREIADRILELVRVGEELLLARHELARERVGRIRAVDPRRQAAG